MKKYLIIICIIFTQVVSAQIFSNQYEQLVSINEQWKTQPDINPLFKSTPAKNLKEQQLIQFHLQQTELLLRKRNTNHLSAKQKKQRLLNLNILHSYLQQGVFPVNDLHANRQPYFIDKYNTYCAVGYLMKMTGANEMAKEINATQKFSYLLDIHHPQLMKWVANSGLTLAELALIQPGYNAIWPSSILEMHYNNIGTDVNEYIELHQSSNIGFGGSASKLLFYDQSNTLYKTLLLSQMQNNYGMSTGDTYYYTFPSNESFADVGKVEIWNTNNIISSVITYSSSSVTVQDNFPTNGIASSRVYNVGEDETTPIGKSMTFCGFYYTNWNPQIITSTIGTVNPLTITPIELSNFNYSTDNKKVTLHWQTITETNNHYFSIEKSTDGINFQTIGKINGAGTTNSSKQYSFIDDKPLYVNQYRLKQVDYDGKYSYSKILFVKVQQANPLSIINNPVKDNLKYSVDAKNANETNMILVYDMQGKQLKKYFVQAGLQELNVSDLKNGNYLLQLITKDNQTFNQLFTKAD